jgi:hypothetical protein
MGAELIHMIKTIIRCINPIFKLAKGIGYYAQQGTLFNPCAILYLYLKHSRMWGSYPFRLSYHNRILLVYWTTIAHAQVFQHITCPVYTIQYYILVEVVGFLPPSKSKAVLPILFSVKRTDFGMYFE